MGAEGRRLAVTSVWAAEGNDLGGNGSTGFWSDAFLPAFLGPVAFFAGSGTGTVGLGLTLAEPVSTRADGFGTGLMMVCIASFWAIARREDDVRQRAESPSLGGRSSSSSSGMSLARS